MEVGSGDAAGDPGKITTAVSSPKVTRFSLSTIVPNPRRIDDAVAGTHDLPEARGEKKEDIEYVFHRTPATRGGVTEPYRFADTGSDFVSIMSEACCR